MITTKAQRIFKFFGAAVLCVCLMFSLLSVYAGNDCQLTVVIKNESATAYIPDFEVRICQVAYEKAGTYYLTDSFSGSGISTAELNKNNNAGNARAICDYIADNNIDFTSGMTNTSGRVVFKNLDTGIYVVYAKSGQAADFSPFIVFLPQKVNASNNYQVTSIPKTTDKDTTPGGGGSTVYKSISVTKIWDDADDDNKKRPDSITVTLMLNGNAYKKAVLSEKSSWKYTFKNLPRSGEYDVKEDAISDYSATYGGNANDGFVIINKYNGSSEPVPPKDEYANIGVVKIWDDDNNAKNMRPDSITVQLIKDGEAFKTAVLNDNNGWTFTFSGLDKKSKYTIKEILPNSYSAIYSGNATDGFVITNKYTEETPDPGIIPTPEYPNEPKKTSIAVQKLWEDDDNKEGKRPDSITVNLIANSSVYKSALLNADDNWQYTFTDLPANLSYTVMEMPTGEYKEEYSGDAASGFVITNTHIGNTADVVVPPLEPTKPTTPETPAPSQPSTPSTTPTIPQTGTNTLPLYIIMALGTILVIAGLIDVFSERTDK